MSGLKFVIFQSKYANSVFIIYRIYSEISDPHAHIIDKMAQANVLRHSKVSGIAFNLDRISTLAILIFIPHNRLFNFFEIWNISIEHAVYFVKKIIFILFETLRHCL